MFLAFLLVSQEKQAGQECKNDLGCLSLCALVASSVVEGNHGSHATAQHTRAPSDTSCVRDCFSLSASARSATRQPQRQIFVGRSALLLQCLGVPLSNVTNAQMCWENAPMQLLCKCPLLQCCVLSEDFPKQATPAWVFRQHLRWLSLGGTHSVFHLLQVLNSASDLAIPFGGKQHDAHEFFQNVLAQLLKDLPPLRGKFAIKFDRTMSCKECRSHSTTHATCDFLICHCKENWDFNFMMSQHFGNSVKKLLSLPPKKRPTKSIQ